MKNKTNGIQKKSFVSTPFGKVNNLPNKDTDYEVLNFNNASNSPTFHLDSD